MTILFRVCELLTFPPLERCGLATTYGLAGCGGPGPDCPTHHSSLRRAHTHAQERLKTSRTTRLRRGETFFEGLEDNALLKQR